MTSIFDLLRNMDEDGNSGSMGGDYDFEGTRKRLKGLDDQAGLLWKQAHQDPESPDPDLMEQHNNVIGQRSELLKEYTDALKKYKSTVKGGEEVK